MLSGKHGSIIGNYLLVDDHLYDEINKYKWYASARKSKQKIKYYAQTNINNKRIYAHRLILKCCLGDKKLIDHKDGNPLNNCLYNLRECNFSQNLANQEQRSKSGYKGVWKQKSGSFGAVIGCNGKEKHLGSYKTAEEAAQVYDFNAIQIYGEFAKLNFPNIDYNLFKIPNHCRSNTNHRYIKYYKNKNKYKLDIKIKNKRYRLWFSSFDEAKKRYEELLEK